MAHVFPQLPQWLGFESRSVSQPSASLPLQSPQPDEHDAIAQLPPLSQVSVA
jgi:hypothetical protein